MLRFFDRNKLPTAKVLGYYRTAEEASSALPSVGAHNVKWPLVIKTCHVTQGSLRSVRMVHNLTEIAHNTFNLSCWIRRMYALRPDDRNRAWTHESNALTDTVAPGFAMQVCA